MDSMRPLFWQLQYWASMPSQLTSVAAEEITGGFEVFFSTYNRKIFVPGRATFGGWFGPVDRGSFAKFVSMYRNLLEVSDELVLEVQLPPHYFLPKLFEPQREALRYLGATEVVEVNSTILLDNPSPEERFSRGNRKRLRQFQELGGVIRECRPEELRNAYRLLRQNRASRGVTLSLTEQEFVGLHERFTEIYRTIVAFLGDSMIGVATTVKISSDTHYVLYWGDNGHGRKVSVVASLCGFLIDFAASQGLSFLDLGKSSIDGEIDQGLLTFKNNLGAVNFEQPKFTLRKSCMTGKQGSSFKTFEEARLYVKRVV